MIPCAQQESACEEEMQSQASGPSRFADEHLADDPVEEECQNAVLDLCLSQAAIEVPQPLEGDSGSGLGEAIAKVDDANKDTTGVENAAATPNSSKQSVNAEFGVSAVEEPSEENSSLVHHVKPVESEAGFESAGRVVKDDDNNVGEEMPEDLVSENAGDLVGHGPSLESSPSGTRQATHLVDQTTVSFAPFLPDVQQHRIGDRKKEEPISSSSLYDHGIQGIKLLQPREARHTDEWNSTSQLLPESFENVQAHDNPNGEKSSLPSNETVEFLVPFGCKEPSLNQHGMHRRSLLLEDAESHRNRMGSDCSSLNPASIVPESRSPGTPVDSEALSSSCIADLNTDFGNDHIVNFSKQSSARLSICPYKTPEPDKVTGYVHDISNPRVTVPVSSGIGLHLNSIGDTVAMSCATNVQLSEGDYLSVQGEEPLSEVTKNFSEGLRSCSVSVDVVVNVSVQATSNSAPALDISVAENSEINHQENEASGMGYSSTSFHAVPLNVKALNSSLESNLSERYLRPCEKKRPVSQDGCGFGEHSQRSPKKNRLEPPNAAENEGCKRCNCKKSKCLKLYCECFAAGVYCIEPCTCLVCFNKPEHEDTVLATRQQIESRNPLAFAPRVVRRVDESPFSSGEDANRTPASARHKRGCNCKKSKCLKKYCECYQAGVGCSVGCRCEGCKNIFGKKDEYGEFIKMKYTEVEGWDDPSEEKLDMVEPKGDILHPKQCHSDLSPVTPFFRCSSLGREMTKSHHPARGYLRTPDSEISNVSSSYAKPPRSPSISISGTNRFAKVGEGILGFVSFEKGQNNSNAEKIDQLRHGSGHLSTSSAHWHGSSVTPMPHAGAKFLVESDSDSGVDNILDDTPEILKDTNSPIKVVKVRSPNQKRVSPPHNYLQELRRSSPSLGLRSGRKFILQSVPSLPRLTPYNETKGSHK